MLTMHNDENLTHDLELMTLFTPVLGGPFLIASENRWQDSKSSP